MKNKHSIVSILFILLLSAFLLGGCTRDFFDGFALGQETHISADEEAEAAPSLDAVAEVEESPIPTGEFTVAMEESPAPAQEPATSPVSIPVQNYAYGTLNDTEKAVYAQMLTIILEFGEKTELASTDISLMQRAYEAMSSDHGNLFWMDGYVYTQYTRNDKPIKLEFAPAYTMDKEERDAKQAQVDQVVQDWLSGVSPEDTDYAKVKYVFENLVERVDYVLGSPDNQNIISVFLNGQTVCQGYAGAAQYMLRHLGVSSSIVTGVARNEPHAWNLVYLDGNYYHMDVTWGNSAYSAPDSASGGSVAKTVNYAYMAMNSEEVLRTHAPDTSFPLPDCRSMAVDYYVREGLFFEAWEPDQIGIVFQDAWSRDADSASVKFANAELFQQANHFFIEEQRIADYCSGLRYIYYITLDDLYVLTINFK